MTMDPTLHYKTMADMLNQADVGGAEQKTETDKCQNSVANIETGAKLSETIGMVEEEEMSISHDEWTRTKSSEEKIEEIETKSNVQRVTD